MQSIHQDKIERPMSSEEITELRLRINDMLKDWGRVISVESNGGCQWDVEMEIPRNTLLGSIWTWGNDSDLNVGGFSIDQTREDEDQIIARVSFVCGENDCDWCCD